ncbi:MAG: DUF3592 domain-containing protein [Lachnospiraceae bacterium]|nr:DUF3592 domain-containing protein [Lachnospiraceae bacterium]
MGLSFGELLWMLLGIAFTSAAMILLTNDFLQFIHCRASVMGKLVEYDVRMEMASPRNIQPYYAPIYEYTVDGKTYRGIGKYKAVEPKYDSLNTVRRVRYNPANPSECLADKKIATEFGEIVLLIVGLFLMLT